jgi:hypothetical protein
MFAGSCWLKKIDQRLSRFLWPFFQEPVAGARQHNDLDIVGNEFHHTRVSQKAVKLRVFFKRPHSPLPGLRDLCGEALHSLASSAVYDPCSLGRWALDACSRFIGVGRSAFFRLCAKTFGIAPCAGGSLVTCHFFFRSSRFLRCVRLQV